MDRTDNYSTEYISSGYYTQLVEARMEANKLLTKLEFEEDPEIQSRFKRVLSFLAKEMEKKYQRREDLDKPDELSKLDNYDMSQLNVNECRQVLESFRDLQEKLGITSMARNEYELSKKGAVEKE